jgi:hypothetical protein
MHIGAVKKRAFTSVTATLIAVAMIASVNAQAPVGSATGVSKTTNPSNSAVVPSTGNKNSAVPQSSLAPATPATATASANGFRSARFGMNEKAVRAAIVADFGVKDADIEAGQNLSERTRMLSVRVPDVLKDGGIATVSYSLGYKSNTLSQVSVLWAGDVDPQINADKLVSNANALQGYFGAAGYAPDSVIVNAAVPEGVLMFRGSDAEGRMTVLLLRGTMSAPQAQAGGAPRSVLTPQNLLLAYIANPRDPDVFKIEAGKF